MEAGEMVVIVIVVAVINGVLIPLNLTLTLVLM